MLIVDEDIGLGWGGAPAFTPATLPNLYGWWKADAGVFSDAGKTTPCADGDLVYTLADQSTNGRDYVQATLAHRPVWNTAKQNGLPGITFDGVSDCLAIASTTALASHTVVMALRSGAGDSVFIYDSPTFSYHPYSTGTGGGALYGLIWTGQTHTVGWPLTTGYRLLGLQVDSGTTMRSFLNGVQFDTDKTLSNAPLPGTGFKSLGGGAGQFAAIVVCELAIYSDVKGSTDLATLAAYFNARWALY